jgi:hypothetical protein
MTDHDWPTREQYEADRRAYAEHLIEHGRGCDHPSFTDAEHDEIARLAPEIIRTVRRECGRIECSLRKQYPRAGELAKGISERPITAEAHDRHAAAVDALPNADRGALQDLLTLRSIRAGLRHELHRPAPRDPPFRFERFVSPEIDRLRTMSDRAITRHCDSMRRRGHQLLADIESGREWQRRLEHMARIDEYCRNGPVIHA